MMAISDDINVDRAITVAETTTVASVNALITVAIPLLELGILVGLSVMLVRLPYMLVERWS